MGEISQIRGFKQEVFERFLSELKRFLVSKSIVSEKVEVIFVQSPVEYLEGLLSRGIVQLGDKYFSFEAKMQKSGNVILDSKAFYYYITLSEVIDFLGEGEKKQ